MVRVCNLEDKEKKIRSDVILFQNENLREANSKPFQSRFGVLVHCCYR